RVVERLPSGFGAEVARIEHDRPGYGHLTILKRIHENSPNRNFPHLDALGRERAAQRIARVAHVLRTDRRFVARFGPHLIPETISPEPGLVLQQRGEGVPYAELGPTQRAQADR